MKYITEILRLMTKTFIGILLFFISLNSIAQGFKILSGIPHLPSYSNSSAVSSPEAGMMIYNQSTSRPEIYTGSGWSNFVNTRLTGPTNEDYLAIKGGIPILPAFSGAKSSDAEIVPKGTIYYDTAIEKIRIWNGSAWISLDQLPETSESLTAGSSFELKKDVDGIQIPVLDSDPTGCEQGAIYINTSTKLITSFDGSGWNSYSINFVPLASNVQQTGNVGTGQVLTGSYVYADNENDLEGTSTFRWYLSDNQDGSSAAVISGETSSTYTIQEGDLGKYIGFAVTPVANTGESPGYETIALTFSGPVGTNNPPVASNVSQSGDAEVGATLTGSYTYSDDENDTESSSLYTWYRADDASGTNEIMLLEKSHDALTYTLLSSDVGYYFRFSVTPVASSGSSPGTEVIASTYIGPIIATNSAPVAQNVYITGMTVYNETLTGNYTYYDSDTDTESGTTYKWYISDNSDGSSATEISGATNLTYTVLSSDISKYIAFSVIPAASNGTSPGNEVVSDFYGPVSSSWTCGASLTVTHIQGEVAPEDATITYQTANAGGYCWLKQSLGETTVASNVDDIPTSWYFQFNRKQGWKLSDPSNPDWFGATVDEDLNWSSENDPCTLLLGSTWRVPTSAEWSTAPQSGQDYPLWSSILVTNNTQQLSFVAQTSIPGASAFWSNTQLSGAYAYTLTTASPLYYSFADKSNALPIRCVK